MDVVSRQQAVQRLDGRIIEGKLGNYHLTTEWLGGGSSANVFLAMNDSTSERVAVKAIDRDSLECSERKQTLLMRELNITTKLHHPNIINLMEVIFDQNYVMLVMEFAAGGELYNAVKDGAMPEPRARWVFFQIASALDYCHKQGVCHRDLKLENLLLVDHDADLVKVTDFGLSKDTSDSIAKTKVGTISYMAPEVTVAGGRAGDPGAGAYDGKASDVWSLGVILYVLIACSYPFGYDGPGGQKTEVVCRRIRNGEIAPLPSTVSAECQDLISTMLTIDPAHRATMDAVLAHPWVADEDRRPQMSRLVHAAASIDTGEVIWPGDIQQPPAILADGQAMPVSMDGDSLNGYDDGGYEDSEDEINDT